MTRGPFPDSVACVLDEAGNVHGSGFLVDAGHVMTCAHVVNAALGRGPLEPAAPPQDARVTVAFLLAQPREGYRARVVTWRPCPQNAAAAEAPADVAVLALEREVTADLAPFGVSVVANATERPIKAYGFAKPEGTYAQGRTVGPTGGGWIELARDHAHPDFVEIGFSGAPIIDPNDRHPRALGMVTAVDRQNAYAVPAHHLEMAWPPLAQPYRGLAAFGEEHARWFFGRENFVDDVVARLRNDGVVAVVGGSGSGKSSVISAGVVPKLRQEGWEVVTSRPGEKPLRSFFTSLVPTLFPSADRGQRSQEVSRLSRQALESPDSAVELLENVAAEAASPNVLLIVDQFEELFTVAPADARSAYDALLNALIEAQLRKLHVAVTLRSDFAHRLEHLESGRHLLNRGRVHLTGMSRKELSEAVLGPASRLNVGFEPGLDGHLIAEVKNDPAKLPLLQYTLNALWQKMLRRGTREGDWTIREDDYDEVGGLEGGVAQQAEGLLNQLGEHDQVAAERLFAYHLVHVSAESVNHDTKAQVKRRDLDDQLWRVAQHFASSESWLLATGRDESGDETVEIVHEALIRNWGRLRDWLDKVRDFRVWHDRMLHEAQRTTGRHDETLWTEKDIETAKNYLGRHDLDPTVHDHAHRMIGNHRAAHLWSLIRSQSHRDEGILELAKSDLWTAESFLDRLLADESCAEHFLADPGPITRAVTGIDQALVRSLTQRLARIAVGGTSALMAAVYAIAGYELASYREIDLFLAAIADITDPRLRDKLAQCLGAAVRNSPTPAQSGERILLALQATPDPRRMDALKPGLRAAAEQVADPDWFSDQLLASLSIMDDPGAREPIIEALGAIAPRVNAAQSFSVSLEEQIENSKSWMVETEIASALKAVSKRSIDVDTLVDRLVQRLDDQNRENLSPILAGLAALADQATYASQLSERLLEYLEVSDNPREIRHLGKAIIVLEPRLNASAQVTEKIVNRLACETEMPICAELAPLLGYLPRYDGPTDYVFSHLIGFLTPNQLSFVTDSFGQGLAALGTQVTEVEKFADRLLVNIRNAIDDDQAYSLGRGLASLAPRVSNPDKFAEKLIKEFDSAGVPDAQAAVLACLVQVAERVDNPKVLQEKLLDSAQLNPHAAPSKELIEALVTAARRTAVLDDTAFELADRLGKMSITFDPVDDYSDAWNVLGDRLALLSHYVTDADSFGQRLIAALETATDPGQRAAFGQGLASVADQLTAPPTKAHNVVTALAAAPDAPTANEFGKALAWSKQALPGGTDLAESMFYEVTKHSATDDIRALQGKALASAVAYAENTAALCSDLWNAVLASENATILYTLLEGLSPIVRHETFNDQVADYVGLLRYPFVARETSRQLREIAGRPNSRPEDPLVAALAERFGVSEPYGFWDVIAAAEAALPEADFTARWPAPLMPNAREAQAD